MMAAHIIGALTSHHTTVVIEQTPRSRHRAAKARRYGRFTPGVTKLGSCVTDATRGGSRPAKCSCSLPLCCGPNGRRNNDRGSLTRWYHAGPPCHLAVELRAYVLQRRQTCLRPIDQLWLDERGTSSDLGDLVVRCECGKSRSLYEMNPLGTCRGARPWLERNANEDCNLPSRLLIRTASNAYFPQVVTVLSLPDRGSGVETAVQELWDLLQAVDSVESLAVSKRLPKVTEKLASYSDNEVLGAISVAKGGNAEEKPVKKVELDALLAAPEGFGDDVPVDQNFHARRLPNHAWRHTKRSDGIEAVIQLHRLREVLALVGFTRFEAVTPDINGEY